MLFGHEVDVHLAKKHTVREAENGQDGILPWQTLPIEKQLTSAATI